MGFDLELETINTTFLMITFQNPKKLRTCSNDFSDIFSRTFF
jgi:hypothetical protein